MIGSLDRRKIVVTGGAGFIGSHLVDALATNGAHVLVIDNLQSGHLSNLAQSMNRIRFERVDIRNSGTVLALVDGADLVYHLAGNASVPSSSDDPRYDYESNVCGTYVMLEALLQKRVGRVLFSSTAAVYGPPQYIPTDEKHPLEPISPYGASKLAAERLGVAYARAFGLDFRVARIYNTFGPRQRKFVMFDLLNKLHQDPDQLTVLGTGEQVRDYSYVSDTVRALVAIAERGQRGEVYNVAGNHPISIRELVPLLVGIGGGSSKTAISYTGESWPGDVPAMVGNISKLRALGFSPTVRLTEGIRNLFEWMQTEIWSSSVSVSGTISPRFSVDSAYLTREWEGIS